MSVMKPLMRPLFDRRDPHWDKVVSLLHFDGDLTDEKGNAWTGFDGHSFVNNTLRLQKGAYISTLYDDKFVLGSSDFTIEFWVKIDTINTSVLYNRRRLWPSDYEIQLIANSATSFDVYVGTVVTLNFSSITLPEGEWFHLAVTRKSNDINVFVNGVKDADGHTFSGTFPSCTIGPWFGRIRDDYSPGLGGNVDELRITKGVARYTDNFTPPNRPFPNK